MNTNGIRPRLLTGNLMGSILTRGTSDEIGTPSCPVPECFPMLAQPRERVCWLSLALIYTQLCTCAVPVISISPYRGLCRFLLPGKVPGLAVNGEEGRGDPQETVDTAWLDPQSILLSGETQSQRLYAVRFHLDNSVKMIKLRTWRTDW